MLRHPGRNGTAVGDMGASSKKVEEADDSGSGAGRMSLKKRAQRKSARTTDPWSPACVQDKTT